MNTADTKRRIQQLAVEVNRHRTLYHTHDAPEISDAAYDELLRELTDLETRFPELADPNSPTRMVGGLVLEKFEKVQHEIPQWSFDNVFDYDGLVAWQNKIQRMLDGAQLGDFVLEEKIDGLKIILTYRGGQMTHAATRGDGQVGENITAAIKTLSNIPQKISLQDDLIVVGEAWISYTDFEKINTAQLARDEKTYANPRNLAAGTLRQLDTSVAALRNIQTFFYDVQLIGSQTHKTFPTQISKLSFLEKEKFGVNPRHFVVRITDEIQKVYDQLVRESETLQYAVDGLVIKLNDQNLSERLGYTSKAPRFAVAYKFPATQKTTKLLDITVQIGRTGALTPVAILDPILIDGSVVSRATLHNADEIARLDLHLGDTVVVEKSGDVIPKIVQSLPKLRPRGATPFNFLNKLAELGLVAQQDKTASGGDGTIWYLLDNNHDEIRIQKLIHFVSRNAMNIVGAGEQIVRLLFSQGLIKQPSDLFQLRREDLIGLEGFQEKSAENLIMAIEKSRDVELENFLFALGIRHLGEDSAHRIVANFGTLPKIREADREELSEVDGIGPRIAASLVQYFQDADEAAELDRLLGFIRFVKATPAPPTRQYLVGKNFVITGSFAEYSRHKLVEIIRARGGKVVSSISSKTDFLLAGENPGSKLARAKELGVQVISLDELL